MKSVNGELRQWVQKIRQPGRGGGRGIGRDEEDREEDEDEQNLAVGPLQKFMGNISKISKAIKRKAEPTTPQSALTPVVKQTPSTSKKPKLSFTTGSKAKRLLLKTPKKKKSPPSAYKTPQKTTEKSSEELATE